MKNNAMVRGLLAACVLCLFLAVFTSTARAAELDLDPTAVLHRHTMADGSSHVVLLTNVPILNGTRYVVCMSTSDDWPKVTCLRPVSREALGLGATVLVGEWEETLAVVGEKSS